MLPTLHPVTTLALVLHPSPMTALGASAQQLVQRLYFAAGPLTTAVDLAAAEYPAAADLVAAVAAGLVAAVAADLAAVDLVAAVDSAAAGLVALTAHETAHLAVAGQPRSNPLPLSFACEECQSANHCCRVNR